MQIFIYWPGSHQTGAGDREKANHVAEEKSERTVIFLNKLDFLITFVYFIVDYMG
ncbi:MAG: hypothetical protein PHV82_08825 [Victivallaceae bacterium]|nr:hypothetical protein [Victivallaceae bacterium]